MNRRGVLRSAAAGVALTVLRHAQAAADDSRRPLLTAIYDERHASARAFAAYLQHLGAESLPTRGDATGLWYGGALRLNTAAIIGLTTWSDLVIARSRGRECGFRLAFEEPHDSGSDTNGYLDRVLALVLTPGQAGFAREQRAPIKSGTSDRPCQLFAWLLMPRAVSATA